MAWVWNGMEWNRMEWNRMEWNGMDVECQDLLIPHRSMHGDDLRFQSQNDEISHPPIFYYYY